VLAVRQALVLEIRSLPMRCDREESLSSLRMPPIISGKMIRMVSRYVGGESSQVLEAICIVL
jgi:hypothetical protein